LIRSWGERWYDAPTRIGDKLAGLIGAHPGEVIIADSTTINLFKLVISALAINADRKEIISDVLNFPTDLYTIRGAIQLLNRGHQLRLLDSEEGIQISLEDYQQALNGRMALVTFSTPTFKSGYLHEIQQMTDLAHQAGALVLWDFSHAVGVVPLDVSSWDVDFAVGCTYKYLNGGPGSPAFIYVNHKHLRTSGTSRLAGGDTGRRLPLTWTINPMIPSAGYCPERRRSYPCCRSNSVWIWLPKPVLSISVKKAYSWAACSSVVLMPVWPIWVINWVRPG
jgi:kynureninase